MYFILTLHRKFSTGTFSLSMWLAHRSYFWLMPHQQKVKVCFGNSLTWVAGIFKVFTPYWYGWLTDTETHVFYVASYIIHYSYFRLILVFIQGFKTEFYIASDETSSSTTEDSVLISLTAYFKQNPVGSMNKMQGTEWHVL